MSGSVTAAQRASSPKTELVEVREEAEAGRWGMTGSSTILVDGVAPFAMPGTPASQPVLPLVPR
ncbi:hypothetical protein TNCT6_69110 [Streptomyces sp. 6-11-2]|nr:hypothetical protein TNCT6_69110 [Streptomyces sp. 6-11-2]